MTKETAQKGKSGPVVSDAAGHAVGTAGGNAIIRKVRVNPERTEAYPATQERLRLPKAGELVARHLRNRIIRGELPEGTMLPSEHDLIRQFGVSRPTLREAIRVLESEQLLEITRGLHGGARVLILATERRPETVAALRACLDESDLATKPWENALAFSRFHHVIIEQTRVDTLILLMTMLNTILDRYMLAVGAVFGQYVEVEAETAKATRSRRKLVGHIEQGESDRAADLWRRYLQEAEVKLRKWQPARLIVDLLQND
jgi:DNA-binding FadR family transcriptional regulator